MTTALIIAPPPNLAGFGITTTGRAEIASATAKLRMLTRVNNEATRTTAIKLGGEAKRLLKDIETARVEVKAPFLTACRQIDAIAAEATEQLRHAVVVNDAELTAYARKLETQRREEEARIAKERAEAERKAREEADRIRREAEAKASAVPDPVQAQQVLDLAAAQAKQAVAAAAVVVAPTVPPVHTAGMRVRQGWTYRVTDVWALAAHDRNLVRPPEPSVSAIRERINGGMRQCPGLEIFEDIQAGVSAK